jgi:hypothetical protein
MSLTKEEFAANQTALYDLHAKYSGKEKRAFIIGNGPSLNKMDLSMLRDEVVFLMNRGYLLTPRIGRSADFWVGVNKNVLEQYRDEILYSHVLYPTLRFVPEWSDNIWRISTHDPVFPRFLFLNQQGSEFKKTVLPLDWPIREGWTVTCVALQIALHMRFKDVYLIGVDHHFPKSRPDEPNLTETFRGADTNHFTSDYFRDAIWQHPDLPHSEESYRMADQAYESLGCHVWNAGLDSKLDIFKRVDYRSLFMPDKEGHKTHFSQPAMPWKIKLSVLLGTYNRRTYLEPAIESIRASVFPETYEIVVVDGGSTDGTREWLAKQPDVVLVPEEGPRTGCGKAVNQGAKVCKGKYVAVLNDDVIMLDNALAAACKVLDDDPGVGQVAIPWTNSKDKAAAIATFGRNSIPFANFGVIRRELGDEAGWWAEFRHYYGDPHLSMFVRSKGMMMHVLAGKEMLHVEAPSYNRGGQQAWDDVSYEGTSDHTRFEKRWGELTDR